MESRVFEYIVKRKAGVSEYAIRAAIVLGVLLISFVTFFFLGAYGLVFMFFAIFFGYKLYIYSVVEYEYRILDDEITVDVIYGRQKRKEKGVFDLKRAEVFTTIDSESAAFYQKAKDMPVFSYLSGDQNTDKNKELLIVVGHGAGNARVYIEVNDEIKEYFYTRYRSKCRFELRK